jgi:hypothetical protein
MDSRICQTSTATPAKPGGLPASLENHTKSRSARSIHQKAVCSSMKIPTPMVSGSVAMAPSTQELEPAKSNGSDRGLSLVHHAHLASFPCRSWDVHVSSSNNPRTPCGFEGGERFGSIESDYYTTTHSCRVAIYPATFAQSAASREACSLCDGPLSNRSNPKDSPELTFYRTKKQESVRVPFESTQDEGKDPTNTYVEIPRLSVPKHHASAAMPLRAFRTGRIRIASFLASIAIIVAITISVTVVVVVAVSILLKIHIV